MKNVLVLSSVIVLAACAGTNFKWEDTEKIQNGMSEEEVVSILGKPRTRSQSGNVSSLMWVYATAFGGGKAVAYRFIDGKVVGSSTVNK